MKTCVICGKGSSMKGVRKLLRGHYNPTSTKRVYPNLQWVTLSSEQRHGLASKFARAGERQWGRALGRAEGARKLANSNSRTKACTKCIKALAKATR